MNQTAALNNPAKCPYCGMMHGPTCFMVKAYEYHPDGSLKRVEFKTAADYPQQISAVPSVFQPPINTSIGSHGVTTAFTPLPGPDH